MNQPSLASWGILGLTVILLGCPASSTNSRESVQDALPPTMEQVARSAMELPETTASRQRRLLSRDFAIALAVGYAITGELADALAGIHDYELLMHAPATVEGPYQFLVGDAPAYPGLFLRAVGVDGAELMASSGETTEPLIIRQSLSAGKPPMQYGVRIREEWIASASAQGRAFETGEAVVAGKDWLLHHSIQSILADYVVTHGALPSSWQEALAEVQLRPQGYQFQPPLTTNLPGQFQGDLALEVCPRAGLFRFWTVTPNGASASVRVIEWESSGKSTAKVFAGPIPVDGWVFLGEFDLSWRGGDSQVP